MAFDDARQLDNCNLGTGWLPQPRLVGKVLPRGYLNAIASTPYRQAMKPIFKRSTMMRPRRVGRPSACRSSSGWFCGSWLKTGRNLRLSRFWQNRIRQLSSKAASPADIKNAINTSLGELQRGPHWRNDDLARVEAALFLVREPISSRRIAQLTNLADGTSARTLTRSLNSIYDKSGSAFRVEEVAGGFQLMTRPMFGPWLRRILQSPVEIRMSVPALETLAVIAYRQPVLRADIEAIRGVQCGDILRQLMERDLVRITGRADELGRPLMYSTTKRFLQVFGLRHLDELPRAEALRRNEIPERAASDILPGASLAIGIPDPSLREDVEDLK